MALALTAVYQKAEEGGYVGLVEELPGAITQGETMEEVRENLREAVALVLGGTECSPKIRCWGKTGFVSLFSFKPPRTRGHFG